MTILTTSHIVQGSSLKYRREGEVNDVTNYEGANLKRRHEGNYQLTRIRASLGRQRLDLVLYCHTLKEGEILAEYLGVQPLAYIISMRISPVSHRRAELVCHSAEGSLFTGAPFSFRESVSQCQWWVPTSADPKGPPCELAAHACAGLNPQMIEDRILTRARNFPC